MLIGFLKFFFYIFPNFVLFIRPQWIHLNLIRNSDGRQWHFDDYRKYYRQQSELIKEYEGLEERVEMEGQTSSTDHKIPLRLSQLSFAVNFVSNSIKS